MSFLFAILFIICFSLCFWSLSKLNLSSGIKSPGAHWINFAFYTPFMVLPSMLAIQVVDIEFFREIEGVSRDRLTLANFFLAYGIIVLILSLAFFQKYIRPNVNTIVTDKVYLTSLTVCVLVFSLLSIIYIKGGGLPILHVFDLSVELNELRIDFTREAQFSPYYRSSLQIISYFGMAYAGMLIEKKNNLARYALLFTCFIGLAWYGAKAPPLYGFLTYFFVRVWYKREKLNLYKIFKVLFISITLLWIFFSLAFSYLDNSELLIRIFRRLFFSSMQGYYYAFGYIEPDSRWIANWVLFGGVFGLKTESMGRFMMVYIQGGKETLNEMSSIFLMDAWGALGYLGLIISPVLLALSFSLSLYVISRVFRRLVSQKFLYAILISYVVANPIILGFSKHILFRSAIIHIATFIMFYMILRIIQLAIGKHRNE